MIVKKKIRVIKSLNKAMKNNNDPHLALLVTRTTLFKMDILHLLNS